jgi:hypothetical protein
MTKQLHLEGADDDTGALRGSAAATNLEPASPMFA